VREGCALVTGASRGIGAACAQALAADGWAIGVNYRSDGELAATVVEAIEAQGGRALALRADVCEAGAADALFGELEERFGPVLVLVNNAGVTADNLSPQIEDEDWDRVIAVNLTATFRLTRAAVKVMMRRRYGRVIGIASVVGFTGNPGQGNYTASKAGMVGMMKSVAAEYAKRNVTANCIAPGIIASAMTEKLNDKQRETIMARVPAGKLGTPLDVAAAAV
jgi:3-oxoacyl-[acyl-carrier protein] reductase